MEALLLLSRCHVYFRAMFIGMFVFPMFAISVSIADGSKDLINSGGYRPFLEAGAGRTTAGIDQLNRFYIYARTGEKLQLGSSAFGVYEGDILFTRPDGTAGSCMAIKPQNAASNWGVIQSFAEEKAGPLPGAGGYAACELVVDASSEGIWEVVFIGPAPDSWKFSQALPAGAPWTQASDVYTIAAWDITVRNNNNAAVSGRVYAKHLPLNMGGAEAALTASLYVLTKDGYRYRVDMNGAAGHTLLLFANTSGFQRINDATPLYASIALDALNTANHGLPAAFSLHNPATADAEFTSTHKLFFSPPADDLPAAALHGDNPAWLSGAVDLPALVSELSYSGSAGRAGSFSFEATESSRYLLTIDLNQNGIWGDDPDVVLAGNTKPGQNIVPWNGLDASNIPVEGAESGYNARVVALAGEVHLPILDLENQTKGFVIERLNGDGSPAFTVFYNDTFLQDREGLPVPLNGAGGKDSRAGAHAFGDNFGDNAGIDTWTYVTSAPAHLSLPLFALNNDLRLFIDLASQTPAKNQPFAATIRVANDGPDDANGIRVKFTRPAGFAVAGFEASEGSFEQHDDVWQIDKIASGAEVSLQLNLQASSSGAFLLLAEVIEHRGKDPDSTPNNFDERLPGEQQEDDAARAPVYVDAAPAVGIAMHLASFTGDLTGFSARFELLVENLGNTPLSDLQIIDNLTARFHGTDFQLVDVEAVSPLVANPSFDGDLDTSLLDSDQSALGVGEKAALYYTVSVTPFGNLGPYSGNAVVFAEGIEGTDVEDISDDGLVVDLNIDGRADGAGENDPTVLTIPQEPAMGLAMEVSNVSGNISSFSADYKLVVENLGNVPLSTVQVINDLGGAFGPGAITISSLSATAPLVVNTGFNGLADDNMLNASASTLDIGDRATLSFHLQASPSFSIGYFNQVARVTALSPAGVLVSDISDNGQEPDANGNGRADDAGEGDVTVVSFSEKPALGVALSTTRVTGDLSGFAIYYNVNIRNLSNVPLSSVQIIEDLAGAFEGTTFAVSELAATQPLQINPNFNGASDKNLLLRNVNTLAAQTSASVTFTVTITPVDHFGPYQNSVIAYGDSPEGVTTTDTSDSGSSIDPDNDGDASEVGENDPTITAFASTGHLGTALGVVNVTGDLHTFNVVYTVVAENLGDVPLSLLSLTQDLQSSLAGARYEVIRVSATPPFQANPLFDGLNHQQLLVETSEMLGVGEQTSVEVELSVVPVDNFGPFELSSAAHARTPFGSELTDQSTEGLNPDPNHNGNPTEASENRPSILSVDERPVIGVSMAALPVQGDLKGFIVRYVLRLENLGDVPLQQVKLTENFAQVFQGTTFEVIQKNARGSLRLNPAFDGVQNVELLDASAGTLAPGDTARIDVDVRVVPVSNFGPYTHTVVATANGPNGGSTTDISDNGFDPDANGNGMPNETAENRPTLVMMAAQPAVGIAKILTDLQLLDEGFEAAFDVTLRNTGDVNITGIQIVDDLAAAFLNAEIEVLNVDLKGAGAFTLNADFDGVADTNLLAVNQPALAPGEDVVVSYTVMVAPGGSVGVFETQALAKAIGPAGNALSDLSNNGTDPDPNGNGSASDAGENQPTLVDLSFDPSLLLSARVGNVSGDTAHFEVQLQFSLENNGAADLDSLDLSVNLAAIFPGAEINVTRLELVADDNGLLNVNFDGVGALDVFDERGLTLASGHARIVKMFVEVIPGADLGPFKGVVDVSGVSKNGKAVAEFANVPPVRVATSSGREAGLESNGDLATLISARNYKQQHAGWMTSTAKNLTSPVFRLAGAAGVDGAGSLTTQAVLDLVPTEGPEGAVGIVTTPVDLFGVTNATSVLAVDYLAADDRLAALFATTSPFDELYDHTKNICDRLKGATLESVELVSIKGHPFVLSVLMHPNGDVDYAISFIGYNSGAGYLVDSRFVRDAYTTRTGAAGEILNFQVWSFNPAYTLSVVEEIISRMEAAGGVDFVSREDDIPQTPDMFVQRGSYQGGQLVFQMQQPAGVSELRFEGDISSVEGGEKLVFEKTVPVTGNVNEHGEVVVVLPSGLLFDALLTVTNDANDNVDQVYVADGPWGKVLDGEEDTSVDTFKILKQATYNSGDDRFVVERGVEFKGSVVKNAVLFRHLKPGGRAIDLSDYGYISFIASGYGTVRLRLEESTDSEDFFTKDIQLEPAPTLYTIFFEEFSKRDGQVGFKGFATSAISFSMDGPSEVELKVEGIVFGKGQPTPVEDDALIPAVYSLSQNYPNPFNPSTTIQFGLPEPASVLLEVFDMLGRQVMTITRQDYPAGRHKATLNASHLASGAYIYRLTANKKVFTKVMHVVK